MHLWSQIPFGETEEQRALPPALPSRPNAAVRGLGGAWMRPSGASAQGLQPPYWTQLTTLRRVWGPWGGIGAHPAFALLSPGSENPPPTCKGPAHLPCPSSSGRPHPAPAYLAGLVDERGPRWPPAGCTAALGRHRVVPPGPLSPPCSSARFPVLSGLPPDTADRPWIQVQSRRPLRPEALAHDRPEAPPGRPPGSCARGRHRALALAHLPPPPSSRGHLVGPL